MISRVVIEVIPPKKHRYQAVGDWQLHDGTLTIRVSAMLDWREPLLVGMHELVEAVLCNVRGVREADVDAFDLQPLPDGYDEHGDCPDAPYHREHEIAGVVERLVAHEMGVDWYEYAEHIEAADEASAR